MYDILLVQKNSFAIFRICNAHSHIMVSIGNPNLKIKTLSELKSFKSFTTDNQLFNHFSPGINRFNVVQT